MMYTFSNICICIAKTQSTSLFTQHQSQSQPQGATTSPFGMPPPSIPPSRTNIFKNATSNSGNSGNSGNVTSGGGVNGCK